LRDKKNIEKLQDRITVLASFQIKKQGQIQKLLALFNEMNFQD
jgi:hypothetical protein